MANCPVCSGQVPDDFGLIECPSCAAPLLVHMDGRVEHSGAQEAAGTRVDFGSEFPDPHTELAAITDSAPPAEFAAEPEPEFQFEGTPEVQADPELQAQPVSEEPPSPVEETAMPEDPFAMPEEPAQEIYQTTALPTSAADSPDLSDIARFGNSGISATDGSLRYNVFISGIDTADVREAFREAITDRKLVWDIDQILRSLKNGEVTISNVTPPKAYVLISRLRNISVQVRWEQYALSQAQT